MGEGIDSMDIRIPECQELFLRELANLGKPTVGVHFDGRPVSSDAADETLNALIEAWTPERCSTKRLPMYCSALIIRQEDFRSVLR